MSEGVEAAVYNRHNLGEVSNCDAVHHPAPASPQTYAHATHFCLRALDLIYWYLFQLGEASDFVLQMKKCRKTGMRGGADLGPISQVMAGGSGSVQVIVAGSATTCKASASAWISLDQPHPAHRPIAPRRLASRAPIYEEL